MATDPALPFQCDVVYHCVSCPHHTSRGVQSLAESLQIFGSSPAAVVSSGTHDERLIHIRVLAQKLLGEIIGKLYLPLGSANFSAGVVNMASNLRHRASSC